MLIGSKLTVDINDRRSARVLWVTVITLLTCKLLSRSDSLVHDIDGQLMYYLRVFYYPGYLYI